MVTPKSTMTKYLETREVTGLGFSQVSNISWSVLYLSGDRLNPACLSPPDVLGREVLLAFKMTSYNRSILMEVDG